MDIVFRVDSSVQMGSGHLMRCLTLANELRRRGARICFVSRLHEGHLIGKLEEAGYLVYKLPLSSNKDIVLTGYAAWLGVSVEQDCNETLAVLDGKYYDWLIVDHYGLDKTWESVVRINTNKIMVIDDLANRAHDCDLLLDQNYFGAETTSRYAKYVSPSTRFLLGPDFALLQPHYAQLREISVPSDGLISRVLVFFGNSDWNNQTSKVLTALNRSELKHLLIDVVVGSNHPDPTALEQQVVDRKGVTFHYDLPTLSGLMMRSDLVISAGGATTWERMCLGKPSIVTCIADNQKQFSQQLFEDGYQILLTDEEGGVSSEMWYQTIAQLMNEPSNVKKMARNSSQLVDGLGVERVADALLDETALEQSKKMRINILSDDNTWLLNTIECLKKRWISEGFQINWVHQPADLLEGEVCFILGCSKILKPSQLALNQYNLVVHESELPEGRGWSPMTWQILEGKHEICVTLFEAMAELDSGSIYAQKWIALNGTELVDDWREKQAEATQTLCVDWIDAYPESACNPTPQCGEGSCYPRRRAQDSELDPDKTICEQFNLLRVVDNERYPAFFYLNEKQYRVLIERVE